MKKRVSIFIPYIFPAILTLGVFSYFLNATTYRYFNPEEKIIYIDENNSEKIKKNINFIRKKVALIGKQNSALKNRLNFVLGYLYFKDHDYPEAETILTEVISSEILLYDYAAILLARIKILYNEFQKAINFLSSINFENSTLKAEIIELYGLSYYELGFFREAADYYEKLLNEYSPTKARCLDFLLILANIYRNLNDFTGENKILKRIILDYPKSSVTPHIKKRFKSRNYSIYTNRNDLAEFKDSLLKEATGYYEGKDFANAIKLYKKYLTFFPDDENKISILNQLKYCYKLSNMEDSLSSLLEEIANLTPDESSLYALGINHFINEKFDKAMDIFKKLIINFPASVKTHRYLYNLARINEITENYDRAQYYFKRVIQETTQKNSTADEIKYGKKAIFKIGWLAYKQKKYYQAIQYFKKHSHDSISKKALSKLYYWTGRCYEHLGLMRTSVEYYKKILNRDRYSYYGLKALENVEGKIPGLKINDYSSILRYKTRTVFMTPGTRRKLEKIEFFLYYDLAEFARRELDDFKTNSSDNEFLFYLASLKHQAGDILGSIRIMNSISKENFNEIPEYGLKLLWPDKYWKIVKQHSLEAGLDPYFSMAIIRQESAFNPEAISVANARGLMQILPPVAEEIAKKLNVSNYNLFKPEDNVMLSAGYMAEMLSKYPSILLAIAAYNAGDRPVKRWMENFTGASFEEFIEEIPYDETNAYVKTVLRNYVNYKRFYSDEGKLSTTTKKLFIKEILQDEVL